MICYANSSTAIDTKRKNKITELLEAGVPQRSIAKEVGCSKGLITTVSNGMKASAQNNRPGQNGHPESPESPLIDDEDITKPAAVPDQDAFQAAHGEHEESRRKLLIQSVTRRSLSYLKLVYR